MQENGRITSGIYTFYQAGSQYQLPPGRQLYSGCSYHNTTTGIEKTIAFQTKKEANYLEASVNNGKWDVWGYGASCKARSVKCPFKRVPAMGIQYNYNYKSTDGYYVYANGVYMPLIGQKPDFILIDYEKALPYCDQKLCKFDFKGWKAGIGQFDIGNAVIDMNNNMKILQVNSLPSNGFFIKQADGLNNIEIIEAYN